jgi:GNAT superfamily N-acetyltransferase/predicted nucleic acid-binding protein
MGYKILKTPEEVSSYINEIATVADRNRSSFGFLSTSAYEQMALKGQLWVVTDSHKQMKGYLMFGGTMPTLKIFQIYSCPSVKGHGVGALLIKALKEHAKSQNYHSISARVASDLDANAFWEKMGFPIYRQQEGGKTTKRMINVRGYLLHDNDLFGGLAHLTEKVEPSRPILARPIYVLDLNLLMDVLRSRQGHDEIFNLVQMGLRGGLSLFVTPELKEELKRNSSSFSDDPLYKLAGGFPEIKHEASLDDLARKLREVVFPCRATNGKKAQNDESDLLHLAYCIAAGANGFITREKALLRASQDIKYKHGVSVISPGELILRDGESLDFLTSANFDFTLSSTLVTDEISTFVLGFFPPDNIASLLSAKAPLQDPPVVHAARFDDELLAVYFFQKPIKLTRNALAALYVDEASDKSIAAIDHFLETALRYKNGFSYRLDIYIGKGQSFTEETLLKKGFFKSEGHFSKIIIPSFLGQKNWIGFAKDIKSLCSFSIPDKMPSKKELENTGICVTDSKGNSQIFPWFDFETIVGPRFILGAERGCVIVPIRENYAAGLMGNLRNQKSLLSSYDKTLLLEKAYFRSPRGAPMFHRGLVVAFYVSGRNSIQEIIGFARITYTDVVDVSEAAVKLGRQGVLSPEELDSVADKNRRIHTFTFDNFLEFDNRVSFHRAKGLGLISKANLVSPEMIGFEKLKTLIGEAFND